MKNFHGLLHKANRCISAEFVMSLGFVLVILSIFLPSTWAMSLHQQRGVVRSDLRVILEAADKFYSDHGFWPSPEQLEAGDIRFGRDRSNREVFEILCAQEGNLAKSDSASIGNVNSSGVVYLSINKLESNLKRMLPDGVFVDPWGSEYQIVLDTDLNNRCDFESSVYLSRMGEGISVWSIGPDRKSGTADDILSWSMK